MYENSLKGHDLVIVVSSITQCLYHIYFLNCETYTMTCF